MALHFEGELTIRAPREKTWAFLLDPHAVSTCLPDVQRLEVVEEGRFKAVVRVGVGFIKGNFSFDMSLGDLRSPSHALISARGSGMGSAVDVRSTVDLVEADPETTTLQWTADVVVSGTIASVGARILSSTVEKKTAELFECIKTRLEG